ncbi:MAG: HEAT repeat domain-containing protein [Planctomycetia bacterium]|nr:HEAT repeat domain-containing protein [Planctomycetia bacterium]
MDRNTIERLCQQLGGDPDVRAAAVVEVKERALKAKPVLPVLLEYLRKPEESYRHGALFIIGWMGDSAAPAIPAIASLLKDSQEAATVRERAAWALWRIGPKSIPALIEVLESNDAAGRKLAAVQLGDLEQRAVAACPALCQCLHHPDLTVVSEAKSALVKIGAGAVQWLERELGAGNRVARVHAAAALLSLDRSHRRAVHAAVASLTEAEVAVRECAVFALLDGAGTHPELATADYLNLLHDESHHVRFFAVLALRNSGPSKDEAILPALVQALDDNDIHIPTIAVQALGDLETAALPALPKLLDSLKNPRFDEADQAEVITAIGKIGPAAQRALPLLISMQQQHRQSFSAQGQEADGDDAENVYGEALSTAILTIQGKVTPEHAIPYSRAEIDDLVRLLGSQDVRTCIAAHAELVRRGKDAIPAMRTIIANEQDPRLLSALAVLREIGSAAAELLPILMRLCLNRDLAASNRNFSRAVLLVFRAIGPQSIPVLRSMLKSAQCPNSELVNETLRQLE